MIKVTEQLDVTITKTSNGQWDYVQIMSKDMVSVNVTLVAHKITVNDRRVKSSDEAQQ